MALPEKILIDTNIIIPLEDNREVDQQYAELNRICSQYGIKIFVHESARVDYERDKDSNRRAISLSKLAKYPVVNKTAVTKASKEAQFGSIKNENDDVDTDLLVSLDLGAVDILITEDKDLRLRVSGTPLELRVMRVSEAVAMLRGSFGSITADFKHVQDKHCDQFHPDDDFFNSLKTDYPGFGDWYKDCIREQRPAWVIMQQSGIGGMIIYKTEDASYKKYADELHELGVPGNKVLKLCLFKVDENIKGEKFGEQLLKKAMDHAYRNGFDSCYVTVFPRHNKLIELLGKFGFQKCGIKPASSGDFEDVYFKYSQVIRLNPEPIGFDFHRMFWPCIKATNAKKYLVPIKPEFHKRLFPEASQNIVAEQLGLFESVLPRTPGNAIRKAYVCNSTTNQIPPGSILLFYRSEDSVITSVGVLESYNVAEDFEALQLKVGNRSVYTASELADKTTQPMKAKAVNFYYSKDLKRPITLASMKKFGLSQPQQIVPIADEIFVELVGIMDKEDQDIFHD